MPKIYSDKILFKGKMVGGASYFHQSALRIIDSQYRDIIFNMLEGKIPYVLLGINNEDIYPTPSVSLNGFKEAYNQISKICSFHKFPKSLSGVS